MNPFWYWTSYRQQHSRQSSLVSLDVDDVTTEAGFKPSENKNLVRHSSWGGVQLGVMAAVKKAQLKEERKCYAETHTQSRRGFVAFGKQILRFVGIMGDDY